MEEATAGRLAEYERLQALGADKFEDEKWMEAIKLFDQAANVIYSKGDEDPTLQGCYVICKSNVAQCCMIWITSKAPSHIAPKLCLSTLRM